MSNDVSLWWGFGTLSINNASTARNTLGYASTRFNLAYRSPVAVAAAHGPLYDRASAPVVCGACPLRLQVHCCLYLSAACPPAGFTCLPARVRCVARHAFSKRPGALPRS
jgi:hypothetical protein